MKKLFAIAFTCVYLLLTVGVVKTTHYCMGRESSSTLFTFEGKKCPCSKFLKENEKGSCCDDEHEILQIRDDHKLGSNVSFNLPDYFEISAVYTEQLLALFATEDDIQQTTQELSLPPPKQRLFKLHCSLVLYDDSLIV